MEKIEELGILKEIFKNIKTDNGGNFKLNEDTESILWGECEYETALFEDEKKKLFPPLKILGSALTGDRRYQRYYSELYQHNVSGKYYMNKDSFTYSGDGELSGFRENLIEVTKEDAEIFLSWIHFLNRINK